jgi:hypothetical protein
MDKISYIVGILAAIDLILISVVIWRFSIIDNNTSNLRATVTPITGILLTIIVLHTALWHMYFQYEPMAMNLYFLITGSMAMIFSISALAITVCQLG